MMRWAEIAYDHMETFMYFGAPGGRAYYKGKRPPTNKYFVGDKFFAGGIQVDGHGNANMIGIKGEGGNRFAFRGPGTVGIADIVTVATPYIFVTHHDRRTLVEKVDYISMHGPNGWRENKYPGPWAEMDHHAARDLHLQRKGPRAVVRHRSPAPASIGCKENTGFAFASSRRILPN